MSTNKRTLNGDLAKLIFDSQFLMLVTYNYMKLKWPFEHSFTWISHECNAKHSHMECYKIRSTGIST